MEMRFESARRFIGENRAYVIFWIVMFAIGVALAIYFFQPKVLLAPVQ